jgi:hypothetical protein
MDSREIPKVKDLHVRKVTEVVEDIRRGRSPVGLPSTPRPVESPFSRSSRPSRAPMKEVFGKKLVFGPKGKRKKHKPRTSKRLFRGNRIRSW